MSKTKNVSQDDLVFGLPPDFDFTTIRNSEDAKFLIWDLPNPDRGNAARGLYRVRRTIGGHVAYTGMIAAWGHDHSHVGKAFGSGLKFARALKAVAPPHCQTGQLRAWRGVLLKEGHPFDAALAPSWTTDRDTAAWFAMRFFYEDGSRPFVYYADFESEDVVALNESRGEGEVIVHQFRQVFVDQDGTPAAKLGRFAVPSSTALSAWREGHQRTLQRRQKASPVLV
ncbi:MAG: hypothetical protein Q7T45_22460 [Bradyrhizobium sp.]|uniref:hypothetical protein n=1 Tax=Bradyrhizobium sp. TaxID=376 RepID=UPI0027273D00|nr:hypothetical protein [Bradyrhizobium sp.]MDO8400585.1 hypothetical protein [Bradyrhizobium sp.]